MNEYLARCRACGRENVVLVEATKESTEVVEKPDRCAFCRAEFSLFDLVGRSDATKRAKREAAAAYAQMEANADAAQATEEAARQAADDAAAIAAGSAVG